MTACLHVWLSPSGAGGGTGPQRAVLQPGPVLRGRVPAVRGSAHLRDVCASQCGEGPLQGPGRPADARGGPGTTGTGMAMVFSLI